jgi:transcription elongation factor GreA
MPHYLTKQGLQELQNEWNQIQEQDLPQTLESLNAARQEGDLKENAGYQTALKKKEELQARIGEIEEILKDYEIIDEAGGDSKKVQIGNTVKLLFLDLNKEMELRIVGTSEADVLENKISNESPLAQAILGKKVDQKVNFKSPQGEREVKILEIS